MFRKNGQKFFDIYFPLLITQLLLYALLCFVSFKYLIVNYNEVLQSEALNLAESGQFGELSLQPNKNMPFNVHIIDAGKDLYLSKSWDAFTSENRFAFKAFLLLTFFLLILDIKLFLVLVLSKDRDENLSLEYLNATEEKKKLLESRDDFYLELKRALSHQRVVSEPNKHQSTPDFLEVFYEFMNQLPMSIYLVLSEKPKKAKTDKILYRNDLAVESFSKHNYLQSAPVFQQNPFLFEAAKGKYGVIAKNVPCVLDRKKNYYCVYKLKFQQQDVWMLVDTFETFVLESKKIVHSKIASVTELATGIAHELNNPLSIVLSGLQNLLRYTDLKSHKNKTIAKRLNLDTDNMTKYYAELKLDKIIAGIEDSSNRMARIIWKILSLNKKESLNLNQVSPTLLAKNSLMICMADIGAKEISDNLVLVDDLEEDLPNIYCRAYNFEFAMLEILKNALWALKKSSNQQKVLMFRVFQQNKKVIFEVVDNGIGIEQTHLSRVFDPFFSTKPEGQGIGLGLFISHYILECQHQAQLKIYSEKGVGTKVIVEFPAV